MADYDPKPIEDMDDEELVDLWTGHAPVRRVPWTLDLVYRSLRLPADAPREEVLAAAQQKIDDDEFALDAARLLAENGYPELDPDLDEGDDPLAEDDYAIGPDGVRIIG